MDKKADGVDREYFSVTAEEFDAPKEMHEFSEAYKRNKKRMLKNYKRSVYRPVPIRWAQAAAAFLLLLIVPAIVSAASGSGFFYRVWGSLGKENIEAHEEILYEEEKGASCIVTYPKREYTDEGIERAKELIGDAVSYPSLVKEIGDTRLTVLGAAYDGSAAVVEFTLEREGGVQGFVYDRLYNESKGAWFSEEAPFYFFFRDCSENILVDMDKSTQESLHCYAYLVTKMERQAQEGLGLTLEIYQNEADDAEQTEAADTLFIPIRKEIEKEEYVNGEGGIVSLSPMSMEVDCRVGLSLSEEDAYDPWHIYYVAVHYKDGSAYVVQEHEMEGVHSCETEIDNTGYTCGTEDAHLVFVFNRLVDTGNVESVVINETAYAPDAGTP